MTKREQPFQSSCRNREFLTCMLGCKYSTNNPELWSIVEYISLAILGASFEWRSVSYLFAKCIVPLSFSASDRCTPTPPKLGIRLHQVTHSWVT